MPRGRAACVVGVGALLATLSAAQSPDPRRLPLCGAKQRHWSEAAPQSTTEHVFGVGVDADFAKALASSRVRAAEAFGIEIRSIVRDEQSLDKVGAQAEEKSSFAILEETRVQRVLEGCSVLDSCRDGGGGSFRVLSRCSRKSREEREADDRASIARLVRCDDAKSWLKRPPGPSSEHVFGVGSSSTLAGAESLAKVRAAEVLGVEVKARTSDRQVLWSKGGASQEESEFEQVAETFVARRVEGCQVVDRCRERVEGTREAAAVLVQCFRRSQFEREVERLGLAVAPKIPKHSVVLVVPGTDRDGFITGLGELGSATLRAAVDRAMPEGAVLVRSRQWEPSELHAIAREHAATHLLRFEYTRSSDESVHVEVWLQRAENDVGVSGTTFAADVQLEPSASALLEVRGPLLPQKDALSIAGELAPKRLPARIPARIEEGTEVQFEFDVPKSGYLYIFSLAENGEITMLRPIAPAPDPRVGPGTMTFPDAQFRALAGGGITACGVASRKVSRENIKAVITSKALDLPEWSSESPILTFASKEGPSAALLLESLNKLKRVGAVIADTTTPYLIETGPSGRGACP